MAYFFDLLSTTTEKGYLVQIPNWKVCFLVNRSGNTEKGGEREMNQSTKN